LAVDREQAADTVSTRIWSAHQNFFTRVAEFLTEHAGSQGDSPKGSDICPRGSEIGNLVWEYA